MVAQRYGLYHFNNLGYVKFVTSIVCAPEESAESRIIGGLSKFFCLSPYRSEMLGGLEVRVNRQYRVHYLPFEALNVRRLVLRGRCIY